MLEQALEQEISQRPPADSLSGRSELEFRQLLEKLPAGAYMCDPEGLITYFNQRAVELWGRMPKLNDPVDRYCGSFKLFTPDGTPIRHDQCWMALALQMNREYNGHEIVVERPNGHRFTVLAHANPIRDERGRLLGAVNVLVDISDRKRAEEALRQARDELELRVVERTAALAASNEILQHEITERKQAEAMARRQATHAKAQADAAALLNAQLDLQTVLATVCHITASAFRASVVLVYLFDEANNAFVFASALGLPHALQNSIDPLPWSFYERYTEELGPVKSFTNLQDDPNWFTPELVSLLDLRRAVIVDLLREGHLTGCLVVLAGEQDGVFASEELSLLKGLADQAAQAITNARLHQEVQARKSQLQQLSQRILKAEEEERRRLSRELHDSVGQMTTALLINLSLLKRALSAGEELPADIEAACELAYKIHDELRSVSHTLRPPELEVIGLDRALSELCQELSKLVQQPILYQGMTIPSLSDTTTVTFYRFVQEALNNAVKHAEASCIRVLLEYHERRLSVTVEDNGVGFNVSAPINTAIDGGVGLVSMRERLEMLDGEMEIHSAPGCGTRLVASYHITEA